MEAVKNFSDKLFKGDRTCIIVVCVGVLVLFGVVYYMLNSKPVLSESMINQYEAFEDAADQENNESFENNDEGESFENNDENEDTNESFQDVTTEVTNESQLNVGGNMDFLNMLEEDRLETKRSSKTSSVTSVANKGKGIDADHVRIGPSDYVKWLEDRKKAFIRLEGKAFGGAPLNIEVQLEVWDSPNSAGVTIDAVRYMKFFKEQNDLESLDLVSAWLMKAPFKPVKDGDVLSKLHELTHKDSN